MRRQTFVFAVFLAFAFCTTAQPVCGKDKGMPEGDKSEKGHPKTQKQKERVTMADKTMRFRGLDRNNDGVITRNEWRGDDRSFFEHDWNNDGVLSGGEVRPDGLGPDDVFSGERLRGRFRDHDHNNDGIISRHEWHDDNASFDRLDSSRDGVLSRAEFAAHEDSHQAGFPELDQNHDGMIALSEWRGDVRLFESRDTDRDGMLSRAEFFHRP
jgi:Ca2+-binding EF-hand superfamily protein